MDAPLGYSEETRTVSSHFGFREMPFGVAPDPRFFYDNAVYMEGLDALVHGIETKKGFMLVSGEVGTGKTILLRKLMRHLPTVRFVFVSSTSHLTAHGLLELVVQSLGLGSHDKTRLDMLRDLNAHLLQQNDAGHIVTLLIDEGQKLSDEVLESLCDLSNLETDEEKLLQIVLVGQPELTVKLSKPGLRRIKQRVAIHHRIHPLAALSEAEYYIRHRLFVAGYEGPEIFNREALEAIWCYSAGTPRLINVICDNALAVAFGSGKKKVSAYLVMRVAGNLLLDGAVDGARDGALRNGVIKNRSATAKITPKKAESDARESVSNQQTDRLVIDLASPEEAETADSVANEPAVSPVVFEHIDRAATEAIGPMAKLILCDQIAALGESRETFPQSKLEELVQMVSREILNENMRARFEDTVGRQINAPKTIRTI